MKSVDWDRWQPGIRATLMFIVDEDRQQVLLIRKKRGLGAGKINGPGGKIDPGETALSCAIRETEEELHVTAENPRKHGELWFEFVDGLRMHVAVFLSTACRGSATETEEAVPQWTPLDQLPLEEMWEDDRWWLEALLKERRIFTGRFTFDDDTMLSHELEWNASNWLDDRPEG